MYGMHLESEFGGFDGEDSLFEMKLRDTHRQQEVRFGACEDDFERTTTVEGDHREREDIFLSRPLRMSRNAAIDQQIRQAFREGFEGSVLGSLTERRLRR